MPMFLILKKLLKKKFFRFIILYLFYILHKKKIFKQLSIKKKFNNIYKDKKILLPIIETNHNQAFHLLILAKALELRGASVKILICGESLDGCEIKSYKNKEYEDPCLKCRFNLENIVKKFNLSLIKYKDFLNESDLKLIEKKSRYINRLKSQKIIIDKIDLSNCVKESVIRYFYGLNFLENKNKIRLAHIKTSIMSLEVAKKIEIDWKPEIILNNMPCYSAWEPIYKFFQKKKRTLVTISSTPLNKSGIFFNLSQLLNSNKRFEIYRKLRKKKFLNLKENRDLDKFIQNRIVGTDSHIKINKIFVNDNNYNKNLIKDLKEKKQIKKIFLFSNVYWDVGLAEQGAVFADVVSWVLKTIDIIKYNKMCHLYIKLHPAEMSLLNQDNGSITTIEDIIKTHYSKLPKNVTILKPEYKINIYKVLNYIDLATIFTGTLGLELMLKNIPVITVGNVPYKNYNFAMHPKTIEQYSFFLQAKKKITRSNLNLKLIRLYSYFYFKVAIMPWVLTKNSYSERFSGFNFNTMDDITLGQNKMIDHLCDCIVNKKKSPESWIFQKVLKN
jgi:hypothetical protein